jgi:hypothetical protein
MPKCDGSFAYQRFEGIALQGTMGKKRFAVTGQRKAAKQESN